jgi:Sulfotransferase family
MMSRSAGDEFHGPLFLVGMPRSGTKLLRQMLCQHESIRFSEIETEFFPFWVKNWARFEAISTIDGFSAFYEKCTRLPFFVQNADRGVRIDLQQWFETCESFTPAGVFAALMRCLLTISPDDARTLWGDKSPSYIGHMTLLRDQFPSARFIHIIRDVRDYSWSMQNAWGKSLLRSAQRWHDDVAKARRDGQGLGDRYTEVRYEDLLADPKQVLQSVCRFLEVTFDEGMVNPGGAIENRGDAKGVKGVLRANTGKYRSRLSPRTLKKIEAIAGALLRELGYPCDYIGPPERLSRFEERLFQFSDGVHLIWSSVPQYGVVNAVKYNLRYFRTSGNRIQ